MNKLFGNILYFRIILILVATLNIFALPMNILDGDWIRVTSAGLSAFAAIFIYRKTKAMPKGDEWGWYTITSTWFFYILTFTFFANALDSFMASSRYSLRHDSFLMITYILFGIAWIAGGLFMGYKAYTRKK